MLACLAPNGQNLCYGDGPPTRLLVATIRGVNVLERERPGAAWIDRGRTLDGHHCGSLMIEPRRGGIFAGMHDGGLYFSARRRRDVGAAHARHHDRARLLASATPTTATRSRSTPAPSRPRCSAATTTARPGYEQTGHQGRQGPRQMGLPVSPPHLAHTKTMTIDPRDPERHLCRRRAGRSVQDDRRRRDTGSRSTIIRSRPTGPIATSTR